MVSAINASLITALQAATTTPKAGTSVLTLSDGAQAGAGPATIFGSTTKAQPTFATTEAFLSVVNAGTGEAATSATETAATTNAFSAFAAFSSTDSEAAAALGALLDIVV